MIGAGAAIVLFAERSYQAQKINEITVQAQILASSVTAAMFFEDEVAVAEYVGAQKANPEVLAAAVYSSQGFPVATYVRDGAGPLPASVPAGSASLMGDKFEVAVAITQQSAMLGTAFLRSAGEPLSARFARYGPIALLVLMASLLVSVLALAQSALTRANRELVETNEKLREQIIETQKAEEALRQSQKMEAIGQLSGGIAHDFNNLLSIILLNLSVLKKKIVEGQTNVMRHIDHAIEGANRATAVTQRILAFSRRQPLQPHAVDLNELVRSVLPLIEHSLGALITIETQFLANWWTQCDPHQMENVVLNLAINSRDAMPRGGKLTIETSNLHLSGSMPGAEDLAPGYYVRLAVTDTGEGMSDDVRLKAIEPFFTTKPTGQGTGLGLSMIYGYVKQSKGALIIDSAPGKGTKMSIILPREGAGTVENHTPTPLQGMPVADAKIDGARRPTVLLVEDEMLLRIMVAEEIQDAGFVVIEEGDGAAALELLRSGTRFDILITDVKLPGVNGFELAEFGIANRPNLPVIIVTGFASDPIPDQLVRAGAKVFYKPYNMDEIIACARQLLTEAA
jgi:signal transduction histidine kinase/ActR/RegA family two-component response regulator